MKKPIFIIIFAILFFIFNIKVYAVTTPTPEDSATAKQDQLINKIASLTAQLKLVERRGIIGTVTDVTNTQITVTDLQNNTRFIDVDELTKFDSPNASGTFGISDITKGSTVGILGLYNKESRRILARFVNIMTTSVIIHGGVSAIDSENYSLSVTTEEGKQMTVNIENLTKTYSYTQTTDYIRSGFSKIKENYNIIAIGVMDKKNQNTLLATRILFFPEIPSSPKVNSALEKVQK